MDITIVKDISVDEIKLQGVNVRTDMETLNSQENLKELAESIRINGLLQPIVLKGTFGNPPYDVIVGQRRFLAHKLINASSIKATFAGDIDSTHALLLSLSENMCRQEMNYADTAEAITKLYNHYEKDEYAVQKHIGLSIRTIRSYIKIEEQATAKVKEFIKSGKISMVDAKRVIDASQGDKEKADAIVEHISLLTSHEKKRLVEFGSKNTSAKVEELLFEAQKPKLEESIILTLPLKVHKALQVASEKLSIDIESLTTNAIINWLKTNDFLID